MSGHASASQAGAISSISRPSRPRAWLLAASGFAALAALVVAVVGGPAAASAADACPNAKYRTGPSLALPDCRAYEMVTPVGKANWVTLANGALSPGRVSDDGKAILYQTATGPVTETASVGIPTWERAARTASGWNDGRAITPPIGPYVDTAAGPLRWMITTPDLSRSFFYTSAVVDPDQTFSGNSQSNGGVFLGDANSATWVSKPTSPNALPAQGTADATGYRFIPSGASTDLSTVYFKTIGTLTPEDDTSGRAPMQSWATYKWKDGQLSNAGVLPDGSISPGGSVAADLSTGQAFVVAPSAGDTEMSRNNAVSTDGKSFLFVSPDPERADVEPALPKPQLYMAVEGEKTILLSAPEGDDVPLAGTEGARPAFGRQNGANTLVQGYAVATPDHSVVLFSSADALTPAAESAPSGTAMTYRYEAADGSLTYLPELDRVDPPDVFYDPNGRVLELSASGDSMLYRTTAGELKLWRKGEAPVTISTGLTAGAPAGESTIVTHSRFSKDEQVLLLNSTGPLRGNPDHTPGSGSSEFRSQVYRYDIAADDLECISCLPGGTPAGASFTLWGATNGVTSPTSSVSAYWSTRGMTDDGSAVYFTSGTALLPEDHNAVTDVYQWRDGKLSLISSGATGSRGERLYDTNADGSSVFIASAEKLVAADTDEYYDVYVARVNGGVDPAKAPGSDVACVGDECQGAAAPAPPAPGVASADVSGAGNAGAPKRPKPIAVRTRQASGPVTQVRVQVPSAGHLVASGPAVKRSTKAVRKAGSYVLRVALTPQARRTLDRTGALSARVKVVFRNDDGTVTRQATVRFKQTRPSASSRKGL